VTTNSDNGERDEPRERIGRYELILELDQGLIGPRYAAYIWDGADEGRIVSLRRAPVSGDARLALQRAGGAATTLRDPKIAALLDVLCHDEELLVASEYVDGESLSDLMRHARVRNSPIPAAVALRIVLDVAFGLRSAREQWEKGVAVAGEPLASALHGGVCPSQIMVASFGDSLLTEIGVSGAAVRLPAFASAPGAIGHRAPEQLQAEPRADERSDIFQLGIILWEMLSHRPLFGETRSSEIGQEQRDAIERRVREGDIKRLGTGSRDGPPLADGVAELVARALERDPDKRFQRFEELAEAIEALPPGTVASSDQVVVLLERVARNELEERRATLDAALGGRGSIPPESRRATARPPGPDASIRVTMPLIVGLPGFSSTESPTARRRPTPATGVPAPTAEEVEQAVAAARAENDEEVAVSGSDAAAPANDADDAPRSPGRSGSRIGIYLALVAVVALGLWWWQSSSSSDDVGSASPASSAPPGVPVRTAEAPKPPPVAPSAAVEPEVPEPAVAPSASAARPTAAPATTPATAPSKRPAAPKPPGSAFRPKGI